jgi:hypothetical protein
VWEGIPARDAEPKAVLAVDRPTRLSSDGTWLLVGCTENQSIRVFRVDELASNPAPRTVGGPGRFNLPEHALVAQGRMFVADTVSSRVHCWNRIEDALAGKPADAVLGSLEPRPATRRDGLFWPGAVSFDGSYLWVGEYKFSGRPPRFSVGAAGPAFQALLERARMANPQRYQYAVEHGAKILPTGDGRGFYLLWTPPGAPERNHPLVVTLHGSASWAFDEFFPWREQVAQVGYGILALQWWFGEESYYTPAELHRELRAALRRQENQEGTALLHGFSRGGANLYGVAAQDRQSSDRFYAMVLANAGGATADFPPNLAISNGEYGYNVCSGTFWSFFCGGKDPNPDRDGCPAMRRTSDWVARYGGVTSLFLEDGGAAAGHALAGDARPAVRDCGCEHPQRGPGERRDMAGGGRQSGAAAQLRDRSRTGDGAEWRRVQRGRGGAAAGGGP